MLLGQVAYDLDDLKAAERAFVAVTFASKMDAAGNEVPGTTKAAALFHLATMAQQRGDLVTARRWASKALTEDSTNARARILLDELEQLAEARTPRAPAVRS
jgi:lipopolysaccharide biosynthesis regulator YciM